MTTTPEALRSTIVQFISAQMQAGSSGVAAGAIQAHTDRPRPTVNRVLADLVATGHLQRLGAGRAVVYRLAAATSTAPAQDPDKPPASAHGHALARWPAEKPAHGAPAITARHMGAPFSYRREFVDDYQPNESSLLPDALAKELFAHSRAHPHLPAGTYARQVQELFLVDLSWHSSRLEGNRKSLPDTRELFKRGRSEADERDATMLFNHKDAIEFMIDTVPAEGITVPVVRNLQSLLMRDLLLAPQELGAIRCCTATELVDAPPDLLEAMLGRIIDKARQVHNPVEAAFFLWLNLGYLQPFIDGNQRTSRLGANMPLLLANCAPLSFIDIEQNVYALAMQGIHERLDTGLAIKLFEWTYRRCIDKYRAAAAALELPDPIRAIYREQLGQAIQQIVNSGMTLEDTLRGLRIAADDLEAFRRMLDNELTHLEPYNCARYRIPIWKADEWIQWGRPR